VSRKLIGRTVTNQPNPVVSHERGNFRRARKRREKSDGLRLNLGNLLASGNFPNQRRPDKKPDEDLSHPENGSESETFLKRKRRCGNTHKCLVDRMSNLAILLG